MNENNILLYIGLLVAHRNKAGASFPTMRVDWRVDAQLLMGLGFFPRTAQSIPATMLKTVERR